MCSAWVVAIYAGLLLTLDLDAQKVLVLQGAEVPEVEKKALANRQSIKCGRYEMTIIGTKYLLKEDYREEFLVAFDTHRLRISQRDPLRDGNGSDYTVTTIINGERFLCWRKAKSGVGQRSHVEMGNWVKAQKENRLLHLFEPRAVGLAFPQMLYRKSLVRGPLASANRASTRVYEEVIDGEPVVVSESVSPSPDRSRMSDRVSILYLSPDKGYQIRRWVFRAEYLPGAFQGSSGKLDATGPFRYEMDVQLGSFPAKNGTIWFPVQVTGKQFRNENLVLLEEVTVRNARFRDIEDELFSVANLGLPIGQEILDVDTFSLYRWDGEKIVRSVSSPPGQPLVEQKQDAAKYQRWLIGVLAAVLAVAGLSVLVVAVRRWRTR